MLRITRKMPPKRSAIIIGAGPAGLSTALRLHQKTDISCRVYELRPSPTTLGGAVGIPCNGLRLAHRLGIHDALLARGSSRSSITIHSLQGAVLAEQDMVGEAGRDTGFGFLRIKREELQGVLLDAVAEAGVDVVYGKRITGVEEEGGERGMVVVRFSDGTTDRADLLLGCDGIHSSVRRLYVDPGRVPEYSGLSAIGAGVPASALSEDVAEGVKGMNITLTQEGMFLAMSCTAADDEFFWGFQMEVPLPNSPSSRDGWEVRREEVEGYKARLRALLEGAQGEWGRGMRGLVDGGKEVRFLPHYRLPTGGRWSRGRCVLLGDAAHAMPPHAGQGVASAFEDAFLLARLLGDPERSLDKVYERFEEIRRPRVEEMHQVAGKNAKIRGRTGVVGLKMKEWGIWAYFGVARVLGGDGRGKERGWMVYDIDEVVV